MTIVVKPLAPFYCPESKINKILVKIGKQRTFKSFCNTIEYNQKLQQ